MSGFDPEYAAQARMRALQAQAWGEKRCGDPSCTGCDAKRLLLCERATSPPAPAAAQPAPVVPPFKPVPTPIFLARIDSKVRALERHDRPRTPSHEVERPRAGPPEKE